MSNSDFNPLEPSKCSSLNQLIVSLLASGFGIFLEARRKSRYNLIDFDRKRKCSNVNFGPLSFLPLVNIPPFAFESEVTAYLLIAVVYSERHDTNDLIAVPLKSMLQESQRSRVREEIVAQKTRKNKNKTRVPPRKKEEKRGWPFCCFRPSRQENDGF